RRAEPGAGRGPALTAGTSAAWAGGPPAPAWPSGPAATSPTPPARPDGPGEGGVRLEAPLPDRQAGGQADRHGEGRPGAAVCLPAGTAGAAVVQPGSVPTAGRLPVVAGGAVALDVAALRPAVPVGGRVGGGVGAVGG